jgi:peptidoglycan/LPS O-acetylase OafA/YrhL
MDKDLGYSLPTVTSLYLDLVRGVAAIAVVFHHYDRQLVDGGGLFPDVGQEAVMAFFVLSGLVISWMASSRERDPTVFVVKRFARFYSVVIPCIIILWLCYYLGSSMSPDLYIRYGEQHLWHAKTALAVTFLNYNSIVGEVRLPTGGPYWSLTYEFWYYFLFAAILWRKRSKWCLLVCGLMCLLLGPKPLLLFPCWLLGVGVFRYSSRYQVSQRNGYVMFFLGIMLSTFVYFSSVKEVLSTQNMLGLDLYHSSYFVYYFLVAIGIAINFLGAYYIGNSALGSVIPSQVRAVIKHLAAISFSLYLLHLPIMFLLSACFSTEPYNYFYPVLTLLILVLVGKPIENTRFALQKILFLCVAKIKERVRV